MSVRLFVIGGLLVLAGLGVGLWPLKAAGLGCGSAFGGASADQVTMQTGGGVVSDCSGDRSRMRLLGIGLLAAGGVCVVVGGVAAGSRRRPNPSPSA